MSDDDIATITASLIGGKSHCARKRRTYGVAVWNTDVYTKVETRTTDAETRSYALTSGYRVVVGASDIERIGDRVEGNFRI